MFCRLCGGTQLFQKHLIDRFDPPFPVYECRDCGFQMRDIESGQAYEFYDEAYYTGGKEFTYQDERRNIEASRIVWQARFRKWAKWDKSEGEKRYLDVGCSFGGLMKVAEENSYVPFGAEVSDYAGAFAHSVFGEQQLLIGNIETLKLTPDYFGIVSLIEVIEHLYDPRKALTNIYGAMKPGGVLLVQTADMDGLQARMAQSAYHYYLPGHLSYFTRRNLTRTLKECGFNRVRFFGGAEFGLLPKLRKSRYGFRKKSDYFRWLRIAGYHGLSKIALGRLHLTSAMVLAAWK